MFPDVSLLTSLLESTSGRPLFEKTLMIEIYETYFDISKSNKKDKAALRETTRKEKFQSRAKFSILDAIKYAK